MSLAIVFLDLDVERVKQGKLCQIYTVKAVLIGTPGINSAPPRRREKLRGFR